MPHASWRPKTGCQREPTTPLALSSSERRDPAHFARLRPLRRPSRPNQHRDFHQAERRLTSYRSGDIARARKKGGLKFLYSGFNPFKTFKSFKSIPDSAERLERFERSAAVERLEPGIRYTARKPC
jgi:hypothetical protein